MKLILALFLAASLSAAEPFEGVVEFKLTNPKGWSHPLIYSLKGEKTRVDMPTPKRGMLSVIVDGAAGTTLVLVEGTKKAKSGELSEKTVKNGESGPVDTGRKEKILGYECTVFNAKTQKGEARISAVQGLGRFRHFEGGPMAKREKIPAWEKEFLDKGWFPLKMTRAGTTLEAVKIEKKSLADSLFEIPAGYDTK
jgi:hypothetical protein